MGTIRKELALLIASKKFDGMTTRDENRIVNEARQTINEKYGKDWRTLPSENHASGPRRHPCPNIPSGDEWADYAESGDDW